MDLKTGIENGPLWFDRCWTCAHATSPTTCAAFPDGVPKQIQRGDFDHANPFPGDNGIRFAPRVTGQK